MKRPRVHSFNNPITLFALLLSTIVFSSACAKVEKPLAEAPAAPVTAPTQAASKEMPKLPPPQIDEVQAAVKRVFKESVVIDTERKQTFIVGDFNGDLSQDLAVVLKPASDKLPELNEEYPNWILRDLASPTVPRGPKLRVTAQDELLAIIHGYEARGWRDDQATQTYLLKNAAGRDLRSCSAREFIAENKGRKMPQVRGDLVEQELRGRPGYLYYASATYSWYDPKSFTEEPVRRAVHMAPTVPKQ